MKKNNNKLFSKLAAGSEMQGAPERKTGAYIDVCEDLSTGATQQFAAAVEFQLAVIGLGYVGLPVAVAFSKKRPVIAFDINSERINQLKSGIDQTGEVNSADLNNPRLILTANADDLKQADIFIVAVPTPINQVKQPDLLFISEASVLVGKYLKSGSIVIYESTVYPGVTEEICAPILEEISQLKSGVDFFLAYSPERINPGDKDHTFTRVCKVVSGQTPETLETVASLYEEVIEAGVYRASSIKIAEAAKVIENTQRDLNIALMNELALIFNKLQLDTMEIIEAASTKWNFLPFKPGLVGGHCIGVDPYYLTHKALMHGLQPEVILAGRRINDGMGKYIAEQTVKHLIEGGVDIKSSRVAILGLTFKENCSDIRNTKVVDIVEELREYGIDILVHDPIADKDHVEREYGFSMCDFDELNKVDAVILAVSHSYYLEKSLIDLLACLQNNFKLVMDIKSALDRRLLTQMGIQVWRL